MAKKRKMTKAQAAAARRDDKPKRAKSTVAIKDNGPRDRGTTLIWVVTIALIAVVMVISLLFAFGPFNAGG